MTGYLMSLNGVTISWRSSRQGAVTLSSSETEFVTVNQAGQEVVYLRELVKGFCRPQTKPTEILEDNAACILISKNLTNRDRSRQFDVKVHYLHYKFFYIQNKKRGPCRKVNSWSMTRELHEAKSRIHKLYKIKRAYHPASIA